MTNKEAAQWLGVLLGCEISFDDMSDGTKEIRERIFDKENEALCMAIKALSQTKQIGCTGCEHYDQQQTALICRDCKRYYKDMYEDGEA